MIDHPKPLLLIGADVLCDGHPGWIFHLLGVDWDGKGIISFSPGKKMLTLPLVSAPYLVNLGVPMKQKLPLAAHTLGVDNPSRLGICMVLCPCPRTRDSAFNRASWFGRRPVDIVSTAQPTMVNQRSGRPERDNTHSLPNCGQARCGKSHGNSTRGMADHSLSTCGRARGNCEVSVSPYTRMQPKWYNSTPTMLG